MNASAWKTPSGFLINNLWNTVPYGWENLIVVPLSRVTRNGATAEMHTNFGDIQVMRAKLLYSSLPTSNSPLLTAPTIPVHSPLSLIDP